MILINYLRTLCDDIIFVLTDKAWPLAGRIIFGALLAMTILYLIYTLVLLVLPEEEN